MAYNLQNAASHCGFSWRLIADIQLGSVANHLKYWFAAMPLIAAAANSDAIGPWFAGFQMPFNWAFLYFASLSFFVSALLFAWRCPTAVRLSRGSPTYNGTLEELSACFLPIYSKMPKHRAKDFIVQLVQKGYLDPVDPKTGNHVSGTEHAVQLALEAPERLFQTSTPESGRILPELFVFVRTAAERVNALSRFVISVLIIFAFGCLALVVSDNTAAALNYLLDTRIRLPSEIIRTLFY